MYNKKLLSKIDLGKFTKSDPYKKDIIYDPMGQWKYPGQNTRIPSGNITMKGLNKPLLGVASTGEKKMMQPGQEYNFPGADYVDEFPQAKEGMIVDLTPAQIQEYRKGGYIIEELDDYDNGGDLPPKVGLSYLPKGERSYYDPIMDNINLDSNASEGELNHEMAHAWQNRQDGFRSDPYSPKLRPSAAASDEQAATYFNRKGDDVDRYLSNLNTIVPELGGHTWNKDIDTFMPDQIKYDKVIDPLMYSDPNTLEGEAEYMAQVYGRPPLEIRKKGGASEQKIIFSPMEGGCPEGQYWTGTECKIIPKNTKIVYSEEELAKSNISKKEQQKLYNQYISRVNNHNAYEAAVLKKYGKIGAKDKYYKTFESIPKHGWDPWMSYGSGKLMPPKDGIPYINEQMVPFKQWKKMMDKSSVKPIGFKGHPGGGHFYPIYEKPSNYLLGYNKEEEPIIPIDPIKEEVVEPAKIIDPVKEEVIVPTVEPVINKQESPLIESMGTQDYPEELEGPNWEWDRKYHSFTTPRLNKHFPLGPLFNGKKKHTFSTPYLHRRKDYEDGGIIADFSRDQIQEYINGGYIVEELDAYAEGGRSSSCPEGMVWSKKDKKCIKLLNFNSNTLTDIKNRVDNKTVKPLTKLEDALDDRYKKGPKNSFSDFGKEKPITMPVREDSFLETLETDINDFLEKPLVRAAEIANNLAEKGEDPSDPLRHSTAGALTAQTIANKTGNIPFISNPLGYLGANIAGIGHELSTLTSLDNRPWSVKLQESLEDMYNNSVGAYTIFNNKSEKDKINYLLHLTRTNQLPDGYGEERPFKDNPKWTDPYNKKQYGGALNKFVGGGQPCPEGYEWVEAIGDCFKINPDANDILYPQTKTPVSAEYAAENPNVMPYVLNLPEAQAGLPDWMADNKKFGKDNINWYQAWNPKKWGLNDYSEYSSYNSAFRNARASKEKEFVYKGERYNTDLIPKKESDLYWESKNFLKDYYKNEPYKFNGEFDSDTPREYLIKESYIKDKYGISWVELYDKIETTDPNDPKYIEMNELSDKIMNEELDIENKTNKDYANYQNSILTKAKQKAIDGRLGSLDKPSYFSITNQKPKSMRADGYWNEKDNKTFMYTESMPGKLNTTYVHELSHKGDDFLDVLNTVPQIDMEKFNKSPYIKTWDQKHFDYVSNPTEIEARKLSTLFYLFKNKKPYKSGKITQEILDDLYSNSEKLPYDIKQLLDLYGVQQEDLLKYLNSNYEYKKKKGGFLNQKQYGGLHKFVDGGIQCPKGQHWDPIGRLCVNDTIPAYSSFFKPNWDKVMETVDPLGQIDKKIEAANKKGILYRSTADELHKLYAEKEMIIQNLPEVTVTPQLSKEGQRLYDQAYKGVQKYNDRVRDWTNTSIVPAESTAIRDNVGTTDPFTGQYIAPNNSSAWEENANNIAIAEGIQDDFNKKTVPKIRAIDKAIQNATVVMDNGTGSSNKKLYTPKYLKKVEAEYEKWLKAPEGDDRQVGNPAYWAPGQLKSAFGVDTYGNGTWTPGYGPRRQPPSVANNYNDGPLQGFHPEVVFMTPAGALAAIPEALGNFGTSLLGQSLTTALPLGEAVTAATAGTLTPLNLIASHYAADAVVNQFPGAISDAGKGEYSDALEKTIYGTLGVTGLGLGKGMVSGVKNLGKFLNTESKVLSNADDVAINLESQIATSAGLKLPGSPNASAVSEPFEIAAKRIVNSSRNNVNRIIKTNKTASTEPAYVQQEFAFPAETVTPSAKLANEQRIIEAMEQARLTGEQTSLASEQANALKASAEIPKTYPIGNPDYFTHLLSMTKMSAADRKFYTSVVDTVKAQGNMASDFQKNMLERIRSGNFNFSGSKGNINAGVSPELVANTAGSKNVVGGRLANFMTDWGLPLGSMLNPALDVGSPIGTIGSKFFSKSSPLNLLLKNKKVEGASMSIGDILSAGVKNGKVSVPKSFFKKTKDLIKKSDDAILTVKNNKTNADIYRVKFDPAVKGSKFKVSDVPEKQGIFGRKKNADFKVTSKKDVPLTEVKLEDPGITVYRRIPFSNRYAVVDKAKLIEGKAQWATTGASAQKFAESYGKGLVITGATGALIWAAEPSEEEKKEVQDKWVKDQQTKAYDDAVKQHEIQVEVEKKAKYEKHKAYITTLITNAVEKGNSQEKVIADLHANGISPEDLIQIYIDNGVPKEEAEEYINTIIRNDIFIKKRGGEILDLTENEINEYKKGGWIVEEVEDTLPKKADGGTVSQIWQQYTGTPWSEAKKQGLTDGTAKANLALRAKLLAGEFGEAKIPNRKETPNHEAYKKMVSNMISKGVTLEELVARRIGTKEGLTNMFSELSTPVKEDLSKYAAQIKPKGIPLPKVFPKQIENSKPIVNPKIKPELPVAPANSVASWIKNSQRPGPNIFKQSIAPVVPQAKTKPKNPIVPPKVDVASFIKNLQRPDIAQKEVKVEKPKDILSKFGITTFEEPKIVSPSNIKKYIDQAFTQGKTKVKENNSKNFERDLFNRLTIIAQDKAKETTRLTNLSEEDKTYEYFLGAPKKAKYKPEPLGQNSMAAQFSKQDFNKKSYDANGKEIKPIMPKMSDFQTDYPFKETIEETGKFIKDTNESINEYIDYISKGIIRKSKTYGLIDDTDIRVPELKESDIPLNISEYYKNLNSTQQSFTITNSDRNYKQQVLPISNIKLGYRNRGDYNDIESDGLELTTFHPFTNSDKLKNITDNTSVFALDANGNLHTGQFKDFKNNKDWKFSQTYMNKIIEIEDLYIDGSKSGNPGYKQPKVKVLENGKIKDGSLNILTKGKDKDDYYGSIQGGRILFVNPVTKQQYLVSGSLATIKKEFKKLKGNNQYLEAWTLDNGTYSRGLSFNDKKLTRDRLKAYDNENSSGGNGLYIMNYKTPVNEYEEEYVLDMPNLRTKNDASYKKGHKLKNEVKNIVLHHTAYEDVKNNESQVRNQYMKAGQNSSHVVIEEDGKRTVYASPEQVTFHAGESEWNGRKDVNDFSIGVEFQGNTVNTPLTEAQIKSFIEYYVPIAAKYNLALKDVISHQMISPDRKPDVTAKEYQRILKYMKEKGLK